MIAHKTKASNCLSCSKELTAATGANTTEAPSSGALSICLYCGAVTIYADDLSLRPLTEAEVEDLLADREIMSLLTRASTLIHIFKGARN